MNTYGPRNISLEKGEGAWVWDTTGKKYLDALAGVAVCVLGHAHPSVTKAISEQAGKLIHCSNYYAIASQQQLAEKLCKIAGMDKVFFGNSGAEANEAALKIARLHGHSKNIDRPNIIVMSNAFHGRTLATLSATGNRKVQAGFEPLVSGFVRAPFNDLDALRTIAANNKNVAAVLVEPIQGEGGVRVPSPDYLQGLSALCKQQGWLLMLDEIQTGNGRTGRYFNYQLAGITPDVVTTAKGLGNGVPIGACLASGEAAELMKPGSHGSTFGGNPLACSAALATVETLLSESISEKAAEMGEYLIEQLRTHLGNNPSVKDIRGQGLMVGIELNRDCPELMAAAAEAGVLLNVTAGNVIRLLPPLIINREQVDLLVEVLTKLLNTAD